MRGGGEKQAVGRRPALYTRRGIQSRQCSSGESMQISGNLTGGVHLGCLTANSGQQSLSEDESMHVTGGALAPG